MRRSSGNRLILLFSFLPELVAFSSLSTENVPVEFSGELQLLNFPTVKPGSEELPIFF